MNVNQYLYLWKPVTEIAILWFMIYRILLFFEGTRARQVMRGIILLSAAFFLFQKLEFTILDWLLTKLFGISVIAMIIIFHPEIRQGLARLGRGNPFGQTLREEELDKFLQPLINAAENLCRNKEGALIVIEKSDPLTSYIDTGVSVNARVSSELIETIFTHNSILHDGGLVIRHGRIAAAGCIFPLTDNPELARIFGTRHRAALGLSEETDALIIVVSEERQDIAIVYRGSMYKDMSREEIISKVREIVRLKK
jgi:diadenylate cyclase